MTTKTIPKFYFVAEVTSDNNKLNFKEPNVSGDELTATLNVGTRSMTALVTEVARALNDAGSETYTCTFDRDTRIVTISSTDTLSLLVSSGSNVGVSVFSLLGITGADRTGSTSYVGDLVMGAAYAPQYFPQGFKSFENNKESVLASVNSSASGIVEVISFGTNQFMSFEFKWVTERVKGKDSFLTNSQTALADLRTFLDFAILKQDIEFMIDESDTATFDTILLESTRQSRSGTGYQLEEMLNVGLDDYFQTGRLRFRKVT